MSTTEDYLNLITSEHRQQPNFVATITAAVATMVQVQSLLTSMIPLFDIDNPPVGDQLDIIGKWVGVSREIENGFTGIFFTWDGLSSQGWDFGVWQSPNSPSAIVVLPDDAYLTLIRAKIAANSWDGTTEGAYKIWSVLFPSLNLLIQDNQNMSFIVAVQGAVLDSLTLALLVGGYLPLRPEGVLISEYVVPADTHPLFGWDVNSPFIGGWGLGSWGIEVPPS